MNWYGTTAAAAPAYAAMGAAMPLGLLAVLVFRSRMQLRDTAWITAFAAAVIAVVVFDLSPAALLVGATKGAWTGLWILLIIAPALLLYEAAQASGCLDRLSGALAELAPTPGRQLLLLAWAFPAFLQGVAGFGVPIVIAAPMLVRLGFTPVVAVAACLVGYHWSVTFGSMGSSFFVAAGTAQLGADDIHTFALKTGALLAVSALVTGPMLLWRLRAGAEALKPALGIGAAMAITLVAIVAVQPSLGSTGAGLAGLFVAWWLLPQRDQRPQVRPLVAAATPYLALTAMVALVFGVPVLRDLAGMVPELSLAFPATEAGFGHVNPAIEAHQPIRPLLHPGPYLLLSALIAVLVARRQGWWPGNGAGRQILAGWVRRCIPSAMSLLGLTILSGVMVEAGMLAAMAKLLASALGVLYVPIAPLVGALGTALTGSTTASNALLAPLQAHAATELGASVTTVLAAQTAGGNVGNAMTPLNVFVAATAVGAVGREGEILRRSIRDMVPMVVVTIIGVVVLAWLF